MQRGADNPVEIWIPGPPVPFQRTRYNVATRTFYQHPDYAAWLEAASWEIKAASPVLLGAVTMDITVTPNGVHVIAFEVDESHKTFKQGMRGDLDNYGKAVLDAGNHLLFDDDRQVVALRERFRQEVTGS